MAREDILFVIISTFSGFQPKAYDGCHNMTQTSIVLMTLQLLQGKDMRKEQRKNRYGNVSEKDKQKMKEHTNKYSKLRYQNMNNKIIEIT